MLRAPHCAVRWQRSLHRTLLASKQHLHRTTPTRRSTLHSTRRCLSVLSAPETESEKQAKLAADQAKQLKDAEQQAHSVAANPAPTAAPQTPPVKPATAAEPAKPASTPVLTFIAPASLDRPPPSVSDPTPEPYEPKVAASSSLLRGSLWLDNVFPMRAFALDPRHLYQTQNHKTLVPQIIPKDVEVLKETPRPKEGGVFVQVEARKGDRYQSLNDIANDVIAELRKNPKRAALTTRPVHCHPVLGDPYLQDLLSRFPSSRLRIEIKGTPTALAELTQEHLFSELRAFGRIYDLTLAPLVKDQPRLAQVNFRRMHGAVGALNCLHRYNMPVSPKESVQLYLSYDSQLKTSVLTDFVSKHPRLAIPIFALLLAGLTLLVFDPLRQLNIRLKITHQLEWKHYASRGVLGWLRKQINVLSKYDVLGSIFGNGRSSDTEMRISSWSAREQDEARVKSWLHQIPDRLLWLTGPKGAGKQALLRKVTADRPNVLHINIGSILDRPPDEFVKGFASAVGFAPGFGVISMITSISDIFMPGASKAAGQSSAEPAQIMTILQETTDALIQISRKMQKKMVSTQEGDVVVQRTRQQQQKRLDLPITEHLFISLQALREWDATPIPDAPKMTPTQSQHQASSQPHSEEAEECRAAAQSLMQQTAGNDVPVTDEQKAREAAHLLKQANAKDKKQSHDSGSQKAKANPSSPPPPPEPAAKSPEAVVNATPVSSSTSLTPNPESPSLAPVAGTQAPAATNDTNEQHDTLPLIIIDGFTNENREKHSQFMNTFVAWANDMTSASLARFLFLTDSGLVENVAKTMPEVKLTEVLLSDASTDSALEFVSNSVGYELNEAQRQDTRRAVTMLGGRYSDLLTLVRSIESGTPPAAAADEIVSQAMSSMRSVLLSSDKNAWLRVHLWQTMMALAKADRGFLPYDDVLFTIFQGDEQALRALISKDVLRLDTQSAIKQNAMEQQHRQQAAGGSDSVRSLGKERLRAGSPVFLEAFKRLTQLDRLRPGMDAAVAKHYISLENKKIYDAEEELHKLGTIDMMHMQTLAADKWQEYKGGASLVDAQAMIEQRRQFLLRLISDSHVKVAKFDEQRRQSEALVKATRAKSEVEQPKHESKQLATPPQLQHS